MKSCIYRSLAGVLLILSETASAAVYYAGGAGASDSGSGSQAAPWATISYAATRVNPGDTVLVASGVYNEAVTINVSGTAEAPIVFRAEPTRQARVQQFLVQGDYITIDGFEITSTKTGAAGYGVKCGQEIYSNARTGCRILNNYLHDLTDTAIYSGINATIRNNLMRNTDRGLYLNSGTAAIENEIDTLVPVHDQSLKTQYIYYVGDHITICGNYLHGTPMEEARVHGVDFFTSYDSHGSSHHILIENNRCLNACHGCEPAGAGQRDSGPITFRNNLFMNTVYVGIYCTYYTGITIENNTFINCGAYPVWFQHARETEGSKVLNNIMAVTADYDPLPYGGKEAESGIRVDNPDWITTYGMVIDHNMMWVYLNRAYGTHDFTAEPQFVDPDNSDFRLRPGSPGIDAGTVTGATTDQNGTLRPYGAAFDTGAYEFHP